jgi:nicotinate-nucleotide adenylyltransferase
MHQPFSVHVAPAGGIVVVPIAELNISATMIRDSLRRGRNPRYLLPDSIYQYIQEHMLYSEN